MGNLGSKHLIRLKLDISAYFNQTKRNPKKKKMSPNLVFTSKKNSKLNTIAYRLVIFCEIQHIAPAATTTLPLQQPPHSPCSQPACNLLV